MDLYTLPERVELGGESYEFRTDFRDILAVCGVLDREELPEHTRWLRALKLFYLRPVPTAHCREAMFYLAQFLEAGQRGAPGPKLFDWQQDAFEIISDINRVAGFEVRKEKIHWWTFLAWFRAIGEGQLSSLVEVRSKLLRGEKLTDAQREFCRRHPHRVRLRTPDDPEKARLEEMLK